MILALALAAAALGAEPQLVDRVAAVVEDEVIALSEVYDIGAPYIDEKCGAAASDACRRKAELEILDTLILQVLIRQELQELELDVTSEELDRSIDQLARDYGIPDVETLQREVERSGVSWSDYKDTVQEQLRQMKFQEAIIRPRVTVSDDDLKDLYHRSQDELKLASEADVQAITLVLPTDPTSDAFVETVAEAKRIADRVNGGEMTWADAVAKHHSGQFVPASGEMGTIAQGDLMAALDEVVFSVAPGQVADPVIAGGVVFLVRVTERRDHGVVPYEDVESELLAVAMERKIAEQSEEWYAQTRKTASIRILLEDVASAPDDGSGALDTP